MAVKCVASAGSGFTSVSVGPASSAIPIVQTATSGVVTGVTSATATCGSANQASDQMVVAIMCSIAGDISSVADTAGINTYELIASQTDGVYNSYLYACAGGAATAAGTTSSTPGGGGVTEAASGNAINVTFTAAVTAVVAILEASNAAGLDWNFVTATGSTANSTATLNVQMPCSLVVCFAVGNATSTPSAGTGFTSQQAGTDGLTTAYILETQLVTTVGGSAVTCGATAVGTTTWSTIAVALFATNAPVSSDHTVTFWCNTTTHTNGAVLWQMVGLVEEGHEIFCSSAAGVISFNMPGGAGAITGPTVTTGVWYFFALSIRTVSGNCYAELYWKVVGEPVCHFGTANNNDGQNFYQPAGMCVGAENVLNTGNVAATQGEQYAGSFAFIKVWRSYLSQFQIEEESRYGSPVNQQNLFSYVRFRDASDTTSIGGYSGVQMAPYNTADVSSVTGPPIPEFPPMFPRRGLHKKSGSSYNKSIAESITTPSDALARAFVGTRSINESVSASDSVARQFIGARSIPESVTTPSDSVARAIAALAAIAESITTPSDSVARAVVADRSIPESVTSPSDIVSRSFVGKRGISESVTTPSDTVTRSAAFSRGTSESVTTPSDSITRAFVGVRAIVETVTTPNDAVTRAFGGARVINESISGPSDSVARLAAFARAITESVTSPSDSVSRQFIGVRPIVESITTPSDALARVFVGRRSISESITTPSDSVSRVLVVGRSIAESITVPSDSVSRSFVGFRSIAESITTPSDSVARILAAYRSIAESITTPSDVVSHGNVFSKSIPESITTPSDAVLRQFIGARSVLETVTTPSDSVSHGGSFTANIAETITTPSDSVSRQLVAYRAISESVSSPTDALTRAFIGARVITETVGVSDLVSRRFVGERSIAESITTPSDLVTRVHAIYRAISESVSSPTDSVARAEVTSRVVIETLSTPSDSVARRFIGARSIAETVATPSDSVSRAHGFQKLIAESIATPSDSVTYQLGLNRFIFEALSVFDTVTRAFVGTRVVFEFIEDPFDSVVHKVAAPPTTGIPRTGGLLVSPAPLVGPQTVGVQPLTVQETKRVLRTSGEAAKVPSAAPQQAGVTPKTGGVLSSRKPRTR